MTWLSRIGAERRFHPTGVALVLSLGLALSIGSALARTGADTALDIATAPEPSTAVGVDLPHTDGFGLLPKPPAFTKVDSARLFAEGKTGLRRSLRDAFGTVLGSPTGRKAAPTVSRPAFDRSILFLIAPRMLSRCMRTIPSKINSNTSA